MDREKKIYAAAGAVAVASVVLIAGYVVRKKKQQATCAALLVAGLAGLAAGAVIALQPEKEALKKLAVNDMLDDNDVALVRKNISEVLGDTDNCSVSPEQLRSIEVDEEASIEDFI